MKYVGSKQKISKYIVPILQEIIDNNKITQYVEPFVGGANIIDKIKCETKIGSDMDKLVIDLYNATIGNEYLLDNFPAMLTKEHYYDVRDNWQDKEGSLRYPHYYRSGILLFGSYNARVYGGCFGGFAKTKDGKIRNYFQEALRNYKKQLPNLRDTTFYCRDYEHLIVEDNMLVYCDIPYKNSIGYKSNFNHDEFWEWARIASESATVIVSEYEAPSDFECIWEIEIKTHMNNRNKLNKTEKLFRYKGDMNE